LEFAKIVLKKKTQKKKKPYETIFEKKNAGVTKHRDNTFLAVT
jgi:hypothetical protein